MGIMAVSAFVGTLVVVEFPEFTARQGHLLEQPVASRSALSSADETPASAQVAALEERLTEIVEQTTAERDNLAARLELLERQYAEVTSSLQRLLAARTPMPDPATTGSIPMTAPASLSGASPSAQPPKPQAPAAATPDLPDGPVSRTAFAIQLGNAQSIEQLKTRWTALLDVHRQALEKLEPRITFGRSRRGETELHLIAGPFQNAESAVRACTHLNVQLSGCEPVAFHGETLSVR